MSTRLLALDTATSACTVALCADRKTYQQHKILPRQHNQYILPMVNTLLSQAHLTLNELDGIVFGQGPGSFTGVRIAVSIAQGLAWGAHLSVIPVSTLRIIAQTAYRTRGAKHVLVGWDARLGEVYWGAYCFNSATQLMEPVIQDGLYAPDKVVLPLLGGDSSYQPSCWRAVGSAWSAYEEALMARSAISPDCVHSADYPQAQDALTIGISAFQEGAFISPAEARPCYLRNNVAHVPNKG